MPRPPRISIIRIRSRVHEQPETIESTTKRTSIQMCGGAITNVDANGYLSTPNSALSIVPKIANDTAEGDSQ